MTGTEIEIDEHGRPQPPSAADETATTLGFLDFQRATFVWKTSGLDAAALAVKIAASSMTLGGMMKHLAFAEDYWFSEWLHGRDSEPRWAAIDWDVDPNWEWETAADDSPEQVRTIWEESVARSRRAVDEALATGGLDQLAKRSTEHDSPSLRWILLHMIEEYARHNGHADLLRESIDGATGE